MIGWILLGLLGVIVLALCIPVRVRVQYMDTWCVRVWLLGSIPVWSFPGTSKSRKKTKKRTAKPAAKKPSPMDELKALFREEGVGGVAHFFAGLTELLKTTLSSTARFITVRTLALCVRVGGEEADEIATLYGKLSAACATGLSVLSQLVRVKKPCVRVIPDFASDKLEARLRMTVWVWPFGVVGVGMATFFKFVALWMKTMKTPQSGVVNKTKQPVLK